MTGALTIKRTPALIIITMGISYLLICLVTYNTYPLALSPQLDAAENLHLAHEFESGSAPSEPFYRASFYPYILSLMAPAEWRPLIGMLFGFLCHLTSGALVYGLAGKFCGSKSSALLASGLYLLNPASIFYSFQILDITFGTTLFLGGLYIIYAYQINGLRALASGSLLALAVATRPHFLPPVLALPIILLIKPSPKRLGLLYLYIPIVIGFLITGLMNMNRSGDFRLLPWQGSYNLWAANKPEANGLHFQQAIDLSAIGIEGNPTRQESIILYGRAHPSQKPPYPINEMNQYWKHQLIEHALENPLQIVKLWAFKLYAVVNSYEQYNNVTFSYHKAQLIPLRFNPINWGILLILASIGGLALAKTDRTGMSILLLLILCYAATLILYFPNARFRLPLVPLLAILAGCSILRIKAAMQSRPVLVQTLLLSGLTALITFSCIGSICNQDSYLQDRLLIANAHADLGNDNEAARSAHAILQEHPSRNEAQRIYSVSYFNLRLLQPGLLPDSGDWEEQKSLVIQRPPTDPVQDAVIGVYLWNWGSPREAMDIWESIAGTSQDGSILAQACLDSVNQSSNNSPLKNALDTILIPRQDLP